MKTVASGQPLDGFDVVTNNHWVPFTFNFTLATGEHIMAATLSMAMRATNSASSDILYLGGTNNSSTFTTVRFRSPVNIDGFAGRLMWDGGWKLSKCL